MLSQKTIEGRINFLSFKRRDPEQNKKNQFEIKILKWVIENEDVED